MASGPGVEVVVLWSTSTPAQPVRFKVRPQSPCVRNTGAEASVAGEYPSQALAAWAVLLGNNRTPRLVVVARAYQSGEWIGRVPHMAVKRYSAQWGDRTERATQADAARALRDGTPFIKEEE